MSTPGTPWQDPVALEEQPELQSQTPSQHPQPFLTVQNDEAFNFLQEDNNPQALPSSLPLAQLDLFTTSSLAPESAIWNNQDADAFPLLNPQGSSFLNLFDTKPLDNEQNTITTEQPRVGCNIANVLIDGLNETIINPGTTNATTTASPEKTLLSDAPQGQHSGTKDCTALMQGAVSRGDLQQAEILPNTGKQLATPSLPETWNLQRAVFTSQPGNSEEPGVSFAAKEPKPSLLPTLHESRAPPLDHPALMPFNGASASCINPALFPGPFLQPAPRPASDGNRKGDMGQMPNRGASFRRVLRRIARTNPGTQQASVGEVEAQGTAHLPAGPVEERRGRKRKATEEEDEEEVRKMRRVRNRESVEKCRAKQKQRLEKLEKEEKERREECILMQQMAEAIQSKWGAVAAEYKRLTGKEAGECPISIPPDIELPELTTMSACDE